MGVIAESFSLHYSQNFRRRITATIIQAFVLGGAVLLFLMGMRYLFPNSGELIRDWATWANDTGWYGIIMFSIAAGCLLTIPGLPGSLLVFTCGAVFPFWRALVVAAVGHHLGSCLSFLISRYFLRNKFEEMIAARPTLKAMAMAAEIEQWKVTFLSRFIVMPVQVKNMFWGVLKVEFKCFFFMAFLGDLQSTIFGVYLGSLSQNLLENNIMKTKQSASAVRVVNMDEDSPNSTSARWLWLVSLGLAITMTTFASIIARRAYMEVLCDIDEENDKDIEESKPLDPQP